MISKQYKDSLGNRVYPKFSIGGFKEDIPFVTLYNLTEFKFFGFVYRTKLVKIYQLVTTASVLEVSKWGENQFDDLINKAIDRYSESIIAKKKLELILKEKNGELWK